MKQIPKHPCKNCICKPSCKAKAHPGLLIETLRDCEIAREYMPTVDVNDKIYILKMIKSYTIFKIDKDYISGLIRNLKRKNYV